ncbi:MAG: hypothetical protein Sylvanvirus16_22, partial [Sylvanvirus sp.]
TKEAPCVSNKLNKVNLLKGLHLLDIYEEDTFICIEDDEKM